jgi:uncharacterized protein with NRDE domain
MGVARCKAQAGLSLKSPAKSKAWGPKVVESGQAQVRRPGGALPRRASFARRVTGRYAVAMCTLAVYVQASAEVPLLVAANRDEFLDRPSADPARIAYDPWVFAGLDLNAGGTWFGVNQHGLVVGLLNRRRRVEPDPTRRSRGLLCLEILQLRSPREAADHLRHTAAEAYNGFNLLVADAHESLVATNPGDRMQVITLPPGVHLLTNLALNDPTCPRIARSSELFRRVVLPGDEDPASVIPLLRTILADHTTALDPRATVIDTLCVHLPGYGTRSSSIVAVTASGRMRYWHAAGPPCVTEYVEQAL